MWFKLGLPHRVRYCDEIIGALSDTEFVKNRQFPRTNSYKARTCRIDRNIRLWDAQKTDVPTFYGLVASPAANFVDRLQSILKK